MASDEGESPPPDRPAQDQSLQGAWRWLKDHDTLVGSLAGVAAVIIGIIAILGGDDGPPPSRPPSPSGKITRPKAEQQVSREFTAEGTLANVPADRHVWLALRTAHGFVFQRSAAVPRQSPSWTATLTEPRNGLGPDLGFSLVLLTVGEQVQQQIEQAVRLGGAGPGGLLPDVRGRTQLATVSGLRFSRCDHTAIGGASIAGTVRILGVEDGGEVPDALNPLQGTHSDVAPDADIWVLVYSPVADRLYPQTHREIAGGVSLKPEVRPDGRFRTAAAFGGKPGERYELLAVLADKSASSFFTRTLRRWQRAGNFAGLTPAQVPQGVDEKQCLQVTEAG